MEPLILQTASEDAGKRLDAWLAEQTELTRSAVQKLMEEGRVTAAGKPLAKNTRLTGGETVSVELPEPEAVDIVPQNIPLDVVYEDEDVIVVNKPKGLVVHPAPGHPDGTLVNALLYHCGDSLSGINGELRPGIVHRIDRDTSGLIIAAKNDFAHVKLAEQLQDHTLARTYRCIVTGNLREDTGTVNAPIGRCPADRKKMAVVAGGRNAVTHWTVLERYPGVNYVECRLETGRTHQIRVHGLHRPSDFGRYRIRQQKTGPRFAGTVPSRCRAEIYPSPHGRIGGADLRSAGGILKNTGIWKKYRNMVSKGLAESAGLLGFVPYGFSCCFADQEWTAAIRSAI